MVTASLSETEMCDLDMPQPFSQLVETPSFTIPIAFHASCYYDSTPFTIIHVQYTQYARVFTFIILRAQALINMQNKQLSINKIYQSTSLWLFKETRILSHSFQSDKRLESN